MTEFEKEVLQSILWQLEGYFAGRVTKRVTTRILRATLRRIKPKLIAQSINVKPNTKNDLDHAVPLKVIVNKLINNPNVSLESLIDLLETYLISVKITRDEHKITLNEFSLSSDMPADWDNKDPLARYKKADIDIQLIS